jgi:hypothetical protein
MAIIETPIFGNPLRNNFELMVTETAPLQLTVASGSIVLAGVTWHLSESQVYAASADAVKETYIRGYIVHDVVSGPDVAVLLVDSFLAGSGDEYTFQDPEQYVLLHRLFETRLQPNASAFGDVIVWRVLPRETAGG